MLRLFVGNLPHSCNENQLRHFFEQQGLTVTFSQIIRDRATGHPRGFGFIEIQDMSDLRTAIDQLNGQRMSGRVLTVNAATPRMSHDE